MSYSVKSCYNTQIPATSMYFKEESICETLSIPSQKPDMVNLLDIMVWPEIESYKIIETDIGRSYEGQNLTGAKLIVEVRIKEKVTYVADTCEQSVHAAHFETLKSIFVILPEEVDGTHICDLVAFKKINVTPYVEAVDARMLDERTIQKCLLLLVDVKIC